MADQLQQLVERLVKDAKTILAVGETAAGLLSAKDVQIININTLNQLADLGQFDFVLISDLLEHLTHDEGEHIIAQIRDLHAHELLVILTPECGWAQTDLIALGLRQIAEIKIQNISRQVFYHALETYKRVPDWLNNKYWANPDLYGKYRW